MDSPCFFLTVTLFVTVTVLFYKKRINHASPHVSPVPPVLSVPRVEYTAVLGRSVSLECVADGQPQPEVTWHKDRRPVVESAHIRIFANGTLAVTSTQRSDAGIYTCTAKNLAGRASQDMRLVIQGERRLYDYLDFTVFKSYVHKLTMLLCFSPTHDSSCADRTLSDSGLPGAAAMCRSGLTRTQSFMGEGWCCRGQPSWKIHCAAIRRADNWASWGMIHLLHCILNHKKALRIRIDWLLHTAWGCWCVHMCGHQRSRLWETGHPPVHQHEACIQGAARWCNSKQRAESGLVLPCPGNTSPCHLLDCQQHSLLR